MRITLGVTGGVAAYKAAELVRLLQQEGFSVQAVMTRAACEFITPLTFAALTGQRVITGLFGAAEGEAGRANLESAIEHIAVAQRTDLLLVAPATADILAKFARGNRRRFSFDAVPGDDRPGGGRAGDEREHVESRGDAGEYRSSARARRTRGAAGRRLSGVRDDRRGTARWPGSDCSGGARSAAREARPRK